MTEKLIRRIKKSIKRRLEFLETEKGIKLSLSLKKERWAFLLELAEELNNSTIYPVKGYTITSQILLPTPSKKALSLTFHLSQDGYSVPYPVFDWYWTQHLKEPILLIKPSFTLNSARSKYYKFLRKKGLAKGEYPQEIIFSLDKSEYKLIEYLI
jgi:hypothetical protein